MKRIKPSFMILLLTNSVFIFVSLFNKRTLTSEDILLVMIYILFTIFYTNVLDSLINQLINKNINNLKNHYYYFGNKNEIAYKLFAILVSLILFVTSITFNEVDIVISVVLLSTFIIQKSNTIQIENNNTYLMDESLDNKTLITEIEIKSEKKIVILKGKQNEVFHIPYNKSNKEAIDMFIADIRNLGNTIKLVIV